MNTTITHSYRLISSSWGIAIDLTGYYVKDSKHSMEAYADATKAKKIDNDLYVKILPELTEVEASMLAQGLRSISHQLKSIKPITIVISRLNYDPTDYQAEGLYLAIRGWVGQTFKLELPSIPASFNHEQNRYEFDFENEDSRFARFDDCL
ncbi:MAG: hypothetical protein ACPG8W_10170 [Candidatus Promineifilaceae bacterium]